MSSPTNNTVRRFRFMDRSLKTNRPALLILLGVVCISLFVLLLMPPRITVNAARQMKCATQLRGIQQSFVVWANNDMNTPSGAPIAEEGLR